MNIRKVRLKPNEYGFDPNLMAACFIEVAKYNPDAQVRLQARGAIALYQKMVDLVTANGGEVEVPIMQHCHHSKEGAC